MDLEKMMKLDLSYPGISFGYHSWSLGIYLETLEEVISYAADEYRCSAKKDLEERTGGLDDEEYIQELNYIDEAADEYIPSYARMSAIVLIWGIFESTVSDIAGYIAKRDGIVLRLKNVRANGFVTRIEIYFSDVLGVKHPWTKSQLKSAEHLKQIRDVVAHRNGQYIDTPVEYKRRIQTIAKQVEGVMASGTNLTVEREYVRSSRDLVFSMIQSLNTFVASRYDGPIV